MKNILLKTIKIRVNFYPLLDLFRSKVRLLRSISTKGLETQAVPRVGEGPAGPFILAEENLEGWVRLPKEFLRPTGRKFFLLRVRGDSINRATIGGVRIEDGDLLLVRQQPLAQSGEIVVALIDGEATVKRLEWGPGYYLLKPKSANRSHKPIIVNRDFTIQGAVVRVLKKGSKLLDL